MIYELLDLMAWIFVIGIVFTLIIFIIGLLREEWDRENGSAERVNRMAEERIKEMEEEEAKIKNPIVKYTTDELKEIEQEDNRAAAREVIYNKKLDEILGFVKKRNR